MSSHRMLPAGVLCVAALFAGTLSADVTLRYKNEIKLNPSLPPQMAQQAMKGMGAALPAETVLQLKEGKGYSGAGGFRTIVDFTSQKMTLLDPENKRYGTFAPDQLATEMSKIFAEMPEQARAAMAAMKFGAESKMTGRSATIQGIEADEREVVITIEGPPMPNVPPGPMMRMVVQFWTAKDSETMRVPAIRELKGYNLWAYATMNPAASLEKMFQQMPGMGDAMSKFMKEMQTSKSALLRMHSSMFMPGMAAMMKQMPPGQSPFGANFDADAAFLEMNQELSEISTAPVPDTVFQVPDGFKSVAAGEIIHDMLTKAQAAAKP
jgi:hypothetical protein